jgi:hypothetical protein
MWLSWLHCHDNSSDCVIYLDRCAVRFWTALTVTVIITVAVSSTVWKGRDQIRSDLLLQSELRALGQAEAQGVYLSHQGRKGSFYWSPLVLVFPCTWILAWLWIGMAAMYVGRRCGCARQHLQLNVYTIL